MVKGKFFAGALIGAALGAMTSLFANPKNRKKLKKEVQKHIDLDKIAKQLLDDEKELVAVKKKVKRTVQAAKKKIMKKMSPTIKHRKSR